MDSKVIFKKLNISLFFVLFTTIFTNYISAQKITVDFNSDRWDKNSAKVVEHLEREALMGTAFLNDVELQNGIIEVDIATTERTRSYPGVLFRVKDKLNYERIYIRPHRSPFYDDALQYAPTFNGVDSWQLYNGPGETSSIDIPAEQWNHLKIVLAGEQAQIFWNDETTPALIIPRLEYGNSKGSIGLSGPMNGTAYYSNFSYEIKDDLTLPTAVPAEPVCGIIKNWQISDQFPYIGSDFTKYPSSEVLSNLNWQSVKSNDKGIVDVSRYHSRKSGAADCIFAKTTISVDKDTFMRFGFGYSDFLTVYLNKQPIFLGVSSYQSRDKSFLGIVGYFDNLFLPLKKGDNELMIQVGEYMGGWGFCFRKEDEVFIDKSIDKKWSLNNSFSMPEAVVYDPRTNALYVANYYNEGNEYISKVSLTGEVIAREWINGLKFCTGMFVQKNKLFAVNRDALIVIDLKQEKIIEKIPLKGMTAPNDVTVDESGAIYISDFPANSVFKYFEGKLEKWVDNLDRPNGLLLEGENLLVGQNRKIDVINVNDKTRKTLYEFEIGSNIDGLQSDGKGNYLASDFNGKLYHVFPDGKKITLMNTATPSRQIADFYYIADKKLIIIPALGDNSLDAYLLKN